MGTDGHEFCGWVGVGGVAYGWLGHLVSGCRPNTVIIELNVSFFPLLPAAARQAPEKSSHKGKKQQRGAAPEYLEMSGKAFACAKSCIRQLESVHLTAAWSTQVCDFFLLFLQC